MAVTLGLDVGFADRGKLFLAQQLVYGDVSKLGLFVGESNQTITLPDKYVVPVHCLCSLHLMLCIAQARKAHLLVQW